jgi:hypothetical protein
MSVKFPENEYAVSNLSPEKFAINTRKLIYLRWQEILVALLRTYQGIDKYPKIENESII